MTNTSGISSVSTADIDQILRNGFSPDDLPRSRSATVAPAHLRYLWHIRGVGRAEKAARPIPGQEHRLISEDVLIGLSGYKIPVAFLISGQPGGVDIYLGTWSADQSKSAADVDSQRSILGAIIQSLYPHVEMKPIPHQDLRLARLAQSGLVLGVPTAKPPDQLDGALPIDRLIRALSGATWNALVLAEPVDDRRVGKLRNRVIEDLRSVEHDTRSVGTPRPLAEHYAELLKLQLKSLTLSQAVGAWRTATYLLGTPADYGRLASVWRAIFSGEQSLPEPLRVYNHATVANLAERWALPDDAEPSGRDEVRYRHPLRYQSILTSSQLAAYIHLPQIETVGFSVMTVPVFDVVPQQQQAPGIPLGQVVQQSRITAIKHPQAPTYNVEPVSLTKHVFVAGVTGAGKTTTIRHLLVRAFESGVPFLIIEPAKTEYRELLDRSSNHELRQRLQIFTLGDELVSPFRLNPFEVVGWPKTSVGMHLDLLRAAFNASFGMWTPLPQLLEQCLHAIYRERGWDIASNSNHRFGTGKVGAAAFPTLSDLVAKVDQVIQQLDYDPKIKGDMIAALKTRLNSLRTGGKGRMLDVQRSLPMKVLLEQPTILELEGIGDDDDRAFLMGLLLMRLFEHRRAAGRYKGLQHLLVIEEAHRLLSSVGPHRSQEEANPRGKAVESFANLLAEVRAYGQGIIVADQVPVKLAPDVIKNTNLKIAHRVVDAEDRRVLAGAMAMTEQQMASLATLECGRAAVFSEGDDAPLLVQIQALPNRQEAWPSNDQVMQHMAQSQALEPYRGMLLPHPGCTDTAAPTGMVCQAARAIAEDAQFQRIFARLVLSTIEDTAALDRQWSELMNAIHAQRLPHMNEQILLRCLMYHAAHWLCGRRGAQNGWSYPDTLQLEQRLQRVLVAKLDGQQSGQARAEFRDFARKLHERSFDPYPQCSRICSDLPKVCLYRRAVADLVASEELVEYWKQQEQRDNNSPDGTRRHGWLHSRDASDLVIDCNSRAAHTRVALCYTLQMYARPARRDPATPTDVIERFVEEAKL
jgi:uncharacterized protein DUF87